MSSTGVAVTGTGSFTGQVTIPETPVADTDAASKGYVDTTTGNYLPLAGGTMSGSIAMGSNNISGGATFTATTFSGQLDGTISSTTTATTQTQGDNSTKVATTAYVDSAIGGQDTLAEILANGNTTGGTDIAITAGDKITNFTSTGIDDNATSTSLTIDSSGRVSTSEEFIATEGNRKGFRLVANYGNWEMIASTSANHLILHSESLAADYVTIKGGGVVQLNDYGSGSNTGTAAYNLSVDSSGNIIETAGGVVDGSGTANDVAMWSDSNTLTDAPIAISGNNATFAGNVGIGISTIARGPLHVHEGSTGYSQVHLTNSSSGSTSNDGLTLFTNGNDAGLMQRENSYLLFGTNDTERLRIDSSGNIGVGVTPESWGTNGNTRAIQISTMTSLSEAFDGTQLASNFYFNGTNDKYIQSDFATAYLQIDGTHRWRYAASGTADANITWSEAMRIDSSGFVLINTTDNSMKSNSGSADLSQFKVNGSLGYVAISDSGAQIEFSRNDDNYIYASGAAAKLHLGTAGSLAISIDENQNVGIGSDAPTHLLTLEETDTNSVQLVIDNNNTSDTGTETSTIRFRHYRSYVAGLNDAGEITVGKEEAWDASGDRNSYMSFATRLGTSGVEERMRITSAGKIGIGLNPTGFYADQLVVNEGMTLYSTGNSFLCFADGASGDDRRRGEIRYEHSSNAMVFMTDATERMRITSGGNVGIGTTSPSHKLDVTSGAYDQVQWTRTSGVSGYLYSDSAGAGIYSGASFSQAGIYLKPNISMDFRVNGSQRMFINSSGQVGIGTSSPSSRLTIKSNTTSGQGGNLVLDREGDRATHQNYLVFQSTDNTDEIYIGTAANSSVATFGARQGDMVFETGSYTERMRIDSNGRVGIGTTSIGTQSNLYLGASSSNEGGQITLQKATGGTLAAHIDAYTSGGTDFMRVLSGTDTATTAAPFVFNLTSTRLGIGTTSPSTKLHVHATSGDGLVRITGDNIINSGGTIKGFNNGLAFNVAPSGGGSEIEAIRIQGNGNVGIGLTTVTDKLDVTTSASQYTGSFIYGGTSGSYGALRCTLSASNSPSFIDFFRSSYSTTVPVGAIVTGGTNVLYQSYSDYRLKENVSDLTGALDRVNNLQPKTFNYINAPETTNEGFIAHELQEVVPQAVSGEKDGTNEDGNPKYQGVDNAHIVPLLVGAIKELKAEIETLKAQINN